MKILYSEQERTFSLPLSLSACMHFCVCVLAVGDEVAALQYLATCIRVAGFVLREMDALGRLFCPFQRRDNFCDFHFAYPWEKKSILMENCEVADSFLSV